MKRIEIKTPAKINLGLRILNKRPDKYHNIETIFYPVKIYDKLIFTKSSNYELICNDENLIENNLITKSKELFEKYLKKQINLKIELNKNIPIEAGLGGGSSDAAATLIGLNSLFDLRLSTDQLKSFAEYIGADVPFFINPVPSFAESKGEILKEIPLQISDQILIVNPGIHISTKWAYQNVKSENKRFNFLSDFENFNNVNEYKNVLTNDFEEIVFKKYPKIENIKKCFYDFGASFALMSGSGSSVYGIFTDLNKLNKAKDYFSNLNYYTNISN